MGVTCSTIKILGNRTLLWCGHIQRMAKAKANLTDYQTNFQIDLLRKRKRPRPALQWETYQEAVLGKSLQEGDLGNRDLWSLKTTNS